MRDAGIRVVDDYRQLIRPLAVSTLEHEVTDFACQILRLRSLPAILEAQHGGIAIWNAHPPRARWFSMQPVAARTGISQRGVAGVVVSERISYFATRATARKHEASGQQLLEGPLVCNFTLTLPDRLFGGNHAEPGQRVQDFR